MAINVGPEDRVVRIVVGLALGLLIYLKVLAGTAAIVAGIIAVALILSGIFRYCLIYKLLGVDTSIQEQSYTQLDEDI